MAETKSVIVSTGDIKQDYEVIDFIDFYHSSDYFDYGGAVELLKEEAAERGADGVIHISFHQRDAVGTKKVCFSEETIAIREIYAWGTLIRLK